MRNENMEQIQIVEINEVRASYVERINELLNQLAPGLHPFTDSDLAEIVDSPDSHVFLIFCGGDIAGMLSVGSYRTPSGKKYWIEDVVVDNAFRGKGFGRELVEYAVRYVGRQKGVSMMLTSAPERVAANELYRSAGFCRKHTNVYKMKF